MPRADATQDAEVRSGASLATSSAVVAAVPRPYKREAPLAKVEELLRAARQKSGGGVIPATQFHASTRADGRPARRCFPVLQHWRNERMVYERTAGSAVPTVRAVELAVPSDPQALSLATLPKPRRRGRVAGICLPPDDIRECATSSAGARAQPRSSIEGKPSTSRSWASQPPRRESGTATGGGRASPTCPHCGCGPADEGGESFPLPQSKDACREQVAAEEEAAVRSNATAVRPAAAPLRSCLRAAGSAATARKDKETGKRSSISFDREDKVRTIQNHCHLGAELWYPGFAVTCDRCDSHVEWGAEGNIAGAPGRSRFTQWQVLCNACLADRLYSEVGAWLVVALAATTSEDPGVGCGVAQSPVTTLLDTLLSLGPLAEGSTDMLVALLGPEAESPEVKTAVLRKARANVASLLSGGSSSRGGDQAGDQAGGLHGRLQVKSEPQTPRATQPAPTRTVDAERLAFAADPHGRPQGACEEAGEEPHGSTSAYSGTEGAMPRAKRPHTTK